MSVNLKFQYRELFAQRAALKSTIDMSRLTQQEAERQLQEVTSQMWKVSDQILAEIVKEEIA